MLWSLCLGVALLVLVGAMVAGGIAKHRNRRWKRR